MKIANLRPMFRHKVILRIIASSVLFCLSECSYAQVSQDSSGNKKDTGLIVPIKHVPGRPDSVKPVIHKKTSLPKVLDTVSAHIPISTEPSQPVLHRSEMIDFLKRVLATNPYFNFLGDPLVIRTEIHESKSYTQLFYFLIGLLSYFGLIKVAFGKYLSNLFTLFFRVSMRQQQIREQVLQAPLPSLLFNALFLITGGLYACFLIKYYHFAEKTEFWLLFLNCAGLLLIVYLIKFILLKFSGWVFNIQRATDTYIFIVFLTNKILGIFLLPILVIFSFSSSWAMQIWVTLSLAMVFVFYAYRFIATYGPVRKEIKVNGFHFFLYLCAFEIAPLLLIYKVLLRYLEKAY